MCIYSYILNFRYAKSIRGIFSLPVGILLSTSCSNFDEDKEKIISIFKQIENKENQNTYIVDLIK